MPKPDPVLKQPRQISPGSQIIQPFYRAGMRTELQKFGQAKKFRQLLLEEDPDIQEVDSVVDTYGLDLTVSQEKALSAIQILFDRTDYQGNIPGENRQISAWKFEGLIPRVSLTYSDYYEAYGLKKIRGQYQGHQAMEALQALKSLAETKKICYRRKSWTGEGKNRRQVSDIIRVTGPVITIIEGFTGLEDNEAEQVLSGQELPNKRQTKMIIEASPLLVDQIADFYLLKSTAFYSEIQALLPGKRIPRTVSLFISWLPTNNRQIVKISKIKLIHKLRQEYWIAQRKPAQLDKRLQEAFEIAKKLNYLLDYKEEVIGHKDSLLIFTLNPERCMRVKSKKIVEEEA